jgi:hypothetical protein
MGSVPGDNTVVADIQLKTYEFTEKCLSFRLASIDMNAALVNTGETGATTTTRSNLDIKLINLYEKFLCALVNFTTSANEKHFKLYRIKHEENLSQTTPAQKESALASSGGSCLTATSSSRLNLTEFLLTAIASPLPNGVNG